MNRRLRAVLIGCAVGLIYGLWAGSITGGGHGNFVWLLMFVFVEFFGLYFPIMAALAVDLRSSTKRLVFASLILFNILVSSILIIGWMTEVGDAGKTDFTRVVERSGVVSIVFCVFIYFLPTIVFSTLLFKSIIASTDGSSEKDLHSLGLS